MSDGQTRPMTSRGHPFNPDSGTLVDRDAIIRAGIAGGFVGALVIWVYEALV